MKQYSCYLFDNYRIHFLTLSSNLRKFMLHFLANDMGKQVSWEFITLFKKSIGKGHFPSLSLNVVFNSQLS